MSKKISINGKWPIVLPDSSADEWLGNMKFHNNSWEMPRLLKIEAFVKDFNKKHGKKPIIMYIGAYKGDMAALMASWGADLILMESTPAFWTIIKECWDLNPELPKPLGFWSGLMGGEVKGEIPSLTEWPTRTAEYIEGKVGFTHLAESGDDVEHFPQMTIDEFVKRTGLIPDMVTMDVEGSELPIMYGGVETLINTDAQYMMSLHPEFGFHNHGYYMRELFDLFGNNGYIWDYIDYDHEWHYLFYRNKGV